VPKAIAIACLIVFGHAAAFAAKGCMRLDKDGRGIHIIYGRFTLGKPKLNYCIYAVAGQHVLINIKPSGDLDTQGYLLFIGTDRKHNWAPGSSGGIVFNEPLPWTGKYLLVVGQRFNERKVGSFEIEISTE
jgi:hypothetical protein